MIILHGKSVYNDICIGKISFFKRNESIIKRIKVQDSDTEIERFHNAKKLAVEQLSQLHKKMIKSVGEADAAIFEIHQMMLEDLDYCDSIENIIKSQKVNAEYAIGVTADNFSDMFLAMDDEYMRGRAADVRDVSERLINVLNGVDNNIIDDSNQKYIIAADDLAPSETVQLDKSRVLGFILKNGSASSHTAILARSMGIPAIIGIGEQLLEEYDKADCIVDGFTGTIYIEPDKDTLKIMKEKQLEADRQKRLLLELKGKDNVTIDGTKINIYANIGSPADVAKVLYNDAGGIGLFRSEFLYLENDDFPTEEQQFAAYKHIFKTQLRALYRAAMFGNNSIMYPMITSVEEVIKIKEIVSEVKEELTAQGIPFKDDVETGIMIETPAAALISDDLAKEVDFFSVGTNDLTQYTLAIDRQNRMLEPFCNTHHKAVLKLIRMAADNAHKEGKWIGICGELGADITLTEEFLKMGIDELSVSANMVLKVRDKVRSINLKG